MQDVFVLWPQWILHLTLVAIHCCVTFFLPVNNGECPIGYLGPGGLHLDGKYPSECVGGAAGYIDRWLLSTQHIYNWPTARVVYQSGPYDPEGILGENRTITMHDIINFYSTIQTYGIIHTLYLMKFHLSIVYPLSYNWIWNPGCDSNRIIIFFPFKSK